MSDSSTSSTAELSNAIKVQSAKQTFTLLADHFQTKILIGKKYQYPKDLPDNFLTQIIKCTPFPLDFILSIVAENGFLIPAVQRNFYKSFKDTISMLQGKECPKFIHKAKFTHYSNGAEFWQTQKAKSNEFVERYLSLLRDPKRSPWLVVYLKDFRLQIGESGAKNEISLKDALAAINRLKFVDAMYEYCQLVNIYDLYDHVPLQSLYNELTIKNQLQILEVLLGSTKLMHYMDYLENILEYTITAKTMIKNSHFINGGKIVSRLSPDFSVTRYPAIYISNSSRQIRWYAHNIKSLINTPGNPKYNFDDICESYLDVIEDQLKKTPIRLLVDALSEAGLKIFAKRLCDRIPECNLSLRVRDAEIVGKIDPTIQFYNITGTVNMLDSSNYNKLIKDVSKIKIISIDCEWNTSDLSITQIGAEFKDNSIHNYILDMLNMKPNEIQDIFKLLWEIPVIGSQN
ncbi:hypothetical protein HDV04_000792 [Boothiomyces sp. JEL0838]|nr:hypothetical protein HDV04_000792 [Boothiomyces sp. JEL0838]